MPENEIFENWQYMKINIDETKKALVSVIYFLTKRNSQKVT